ncbi:putative uncharacterized protein [Firmicutes bacterium CAG:822]|nr:putative uncharacterized protein [Firmicutes bacterium CAG:822]
MIFVALGTQDKSFERLLKIIDENIQNKVINEEVIVQSGYTKYKSDNMQIFDYVSMDDFNKYINECSLFITHGGVGNILSALKVNKKIIAVPRLAKYKEHTNDHQLQIVNNFYEKAYILRLLENDDFKDVYEKSKTFVPKKWISNNENLLKKIKEYIDND